MGPGFGEAVGRLTASVVTLALVVVMGVAFAAGYAFKGCDRHVEVRVVRNAEPGR